jgi:prepilin-type N-terminal cleavage/methylation domain-containing protein
MDGAVVNGDKGFTLIEAVIAAAIAGILTMAASVGVANFEARYRLLGGVWEIEARLNAARFGAAARGAPVRVRAAGSSIFLERRLPDPAGWAPFESHVLPGVAVQANAAPVFSPQGTVAPLATIQVWNRAGRYRITLAITGRVRARRV